MPTFNRFDILQAYHLFGTLYHGGQGTKEYGYTTRAHMAGFLPGLSHNYNSLSENGREIYQALVVGDLAKRGIIAVNPSDADWCKGYVVYAFGAYGEKLAAWGTGLDSCLDMCVDWLEEQGKTGYFCDAEVEEAYQAELRAAGGEDTDVCWENAAVDTVCAGNAGHYLHSWEVQIVETHGVE